MTKNYLMGLIAISSILILSCNKDKLPENALVCETDITYDDTRTLINNTCAYSGCHDGISNPDNFKSYESIEKFFDNGRFAERVFSNRDMPPDYAILGPTMLTQEELELLMCWEQNDFAKN